MKDSKYNIYLFIHLLIVFAFAGVVAITQVSCDKYKFLELLLQFAAVIATLLGGILAYFAIQNYSLNKRRMEYRFDVMVRLYEKLNELKIYPKGFKPISSPIGFLNFVTAPIESYTVLKEIDSQLGEEGLDQSQHFFLKFDIDEIDEILLLSRNPFIPSDVQKLFKIIDHVNWLKVKMDPEKMKFSDDKVVNFVELITSENSRLKPYKWSDSNEFTLGRFLREINQLHIAIESWVNENSK